MKNNTRIIEEILLNKTLFILENENLQIRDAELKAITEFLQNIPRSDASETFEAFMKEVVIKKYPHHLNNVLNYCAWKDAQLRLKVDYRGLIECTPWKNIRVSP